MLSMLEVHQFSVGLCRDPDRSGLQERDAAAWMKVYGSLQDMLQHAATVCYREGKIHQVHPHKQQKYFMSGIRDTCIYSKP